jgi:nitroimidazol reductase NimA-like FMN-containing flavoprotein (pyridoxamine 5'-phosphate oxidase superfamily)
LSGTLPGVTTAPTDPTPTDRTPTDRTTVRRLAERGVYEREVIDAILDEALVCQVGFVVDGRPVVIPTIHARRGDTLYLHGSPASRMLRSMRTGDEICVTVTLVDGVVLARAPFHSSLNYRSVVLFGEPRLVEDPEEKSLAFEVLTEHIAPGRWDDSRLPNLKEEKGTLVAALVIAEVSAKVRTGPPKDDDEDYELPIWAGVIPLEIRAGEPVPDPRLGPGIEAPDYVGRYRRPGADG